MQTNFERDSTFPTNAAATSTPTIMVSYASEDLAPVIELQAHLEAAGASTTVGPAIIQSTGRKIRVSTGEHWPVDEPTELRIKI